MIMHGPTRCSHFVGDLKAVLQLVSNALWLGIQVIDLYRRLGSGLEARLS